MSEERETPAEIPLDEEWDDTPTALWLRAIFTLLAGGFLSWAQWHAPIGDVGTEWPRWIWLAFVANLVLPMGIVWLFFAQGLGRADYLKNQALNAWNYGWDFRDWKTHCKFAGAMLLVMLPFLIWQSRDPANKAAYASYLANFRDPLGHINPLAMLKFFALIAVYMFCWEWFHRGFLLFGIAQGTGAIPAIVLQAILFGAAHAGKPQVEMWSAFAGGAVLGTIAWRQKSFATAFYTHTLVHMTWMILLLF